MEEPSHREDVDRQLGPLTRHFLGCESGLRGVAAGAKIGVVWILEKEQVQVPGAGEPLFLPLAVLAKRHGAPQFVEQGRDLSRCRARLVDPDV
jgi:hypothetical protein